MTNVLLIICKFDSRLTARCLSKSAAASATRRGVPPPQSLAESTSLHFTSLATQPLIFYFNGKREHFVHRVENYSKDQRKSIVKISNEFQTLRRARAQNKSRAERYWLYSVQSRERRKIFWRTVKGLEITT